MSKYAALFHREFAGLLDTVTGSEIEVTLVALDAHGYRPRDEVYAGIVEQLAWAHTPVGIGHYFATVVISESIHCKKPDPRIFQHALEEIGRLFAIT